VKGILLYMKMEDIRPIEMKDFEKSLEKIRPSVSVEGLQKFEEWADKFGERA
jgi:SpoVK/Ycf46/Vps4 family AAA+-type ATPase